MMLLEDSYGRRIRKVRVSLLDACNFRCFYCMPKSPSFLPAKNCLSLDELYQISLCFFEHGIEELRLTGGEATLRKDFKNIVTELSKIPFQKLSLTSNGFFLSPLLSFLKNTSCQFLNISLDSLREDRFRAITHSNGFHKVLGSIIEASRLGFSVKINVVVMRGVNDDELLDFVRFSSEHQITVRFLELMQIGEARKIEKKAFISAAELLTQLQQKIDLEAVAVEQDSTSFEFKTKSGARLGFIAPVTQSFCGSCSRWRLSAEGFLRACLMSSKGLSLKGQSGKELRETLSKVLHMKPISGLESVDQNMYRIGG
ncbi:MAG: GTP 3',8-cyclase MoaA [Oligoflexales bacterium]|nr:GTP 3',8-cyclase MoaA [Oligoflexales bacterium]